MRKSIFRGKGKYNSITYIKYGEYKSVYNGGTAKRLFKRPAHKGYRRLSKEMIRGGDYTEVPFITEYWD